MLKIPIDEAPAGPVMDAAVAKALGCNVVIEKYEGRQAAFCNCESREHESPITYVSLMLKRYSTDIESAWELSKKVNDFEVMLEDKGVWFCYIGDCGRAETAPLAICRAFLKANGVEYLELKDE